MGTPALCSDRPDFPSRRRWLYGSAQFCLYEFFADSYIVSSFAGAFAQSRALHEPKYATVFDKTMIALPCLTLATNVVATSLVLSRIMYAFLFFSFNADLPDGHVPARSISR
jgi:cellulose synthase/poly-beta-1,6-N-acetylglucosamine synthase-like glycosyltransferase